MDMGERLRPNILLLLASELGAWSLGCAGMTQLETPHLDALSREGIRFTQCRGGPLFPLLERMPTLQAQGSDGQDEQISASYAYRELAYPQQLAAAGYVCGHGGRRLPGFDRPHSGFVHWYVGSDDELPYRQAQMVRYGQAAPEPAYLTEAITDDALSFLDWQDGQRPFFLELWYTAPQGAMQYAHHPEAWVSHYRARGLDRQALVERLSGHIGEVEPIEAAVRYGAAVSALDEQIGRILNKLAQKGMREETLVMFTSESSLASLQKTTEAGGEEETASVPLIISQPGRIPLDCVAERPLSGREVMQTVLDDVLAAESGGSLVADKILAVNLLEGE